MIWTIFAPGQTLSVWANNEKQARQQARWILGVEKLPKGTLVAVWKRD